MKLTISIFLFLGLLWLTDAGYPQLYFAGNFLADTATLNNDPYNWNIHAFNASRDPPCYPNYTFPHCDWNPTGGSDFRFVNCFVTKVCYIGGRCYQNDSVVGKRIIGSDDTVAAKMTDLDPFFQMYTAQLWGLIVGVEGAFQGKFKTNTVMDVWQRCKEEKCLGDPGTSGYWSSVLTDVTWTEADTGSTFINELRYSQQDSSNGILNIKFTVDLMHEDPRRPDFALGRVVGTISAVDGSLGHLPEFNRMMWWQGPQWLSPDVPRESPENSTYWNAPFYVDDVSKKVVVDLSNSLPTDLEGNLRDDLIGNIYLVVLQQLLSLPIVEGRIMDCSTLLAPCCTNLGRIPYTSPGFLLKNSGIASFCLRPLAQKYPLMIVREEKVSCPDSADCPKQCTPILVERLNGLYVGPAEDRVFRIPQPKTENPSSKPQGEDGKVCWSSTVFATQFGKPKAGVGLTLHHYDRHGLNTGEPADVINVLPFDCSGYAKPSTNAYGIGAFGFQTDEGGLDCSRRPPNRAYLAGQLYIYNITLSAKRHMILEWLKPTPDTAPELHQLEVIKRNLHTALRLEWATIPPYLSAYYSIKEGYNKEIAMLLKTIIIEEMSHMSMVANILNFLGEAPIFTNPTQWPKYPEVFAPKNENLDKQVPIPFCVLNICSAIEGIRYILGEGEGGDPCNPCFEEELSHYYKFKEIWKGRQLVDGEGKTCKNSFQSCTTESCDNNTDDQSSDTDPFTPCNDVPYCPKNYTFTGPIIPFNEEGVWPTLPNPSTSHYPPGSRARILSDSFNLKYTNLMTCLHDTFNGNPGQFSQCYALMTSLTVDAKRLVQTNLTATDDVYGAPTFEWYSRDGNN
ncbi:hypothetical protein Bbelb_274180 [Branchiostoma belcheri]|nr:hypothetical protein Bbelb_274180 [Branchiostoma belcheri]